MKFLHTLILYFGIFIVGFIIPIFIFHVMKNHQISHTPNNIHHTKNNHSPDEKNDSDFDEIPLYINRQLPLLNPFHSPYQVIEAACQKRHSFYGNKTRYEWAKMLTISLFEKKLGEQRFLEVNVDASIWNNIPLMHKKMMASDLISCYPRRSYLHPINRIDVIDASNGQLIIQFGKKGWKIFPKKKELQEDNLF